MSINKHRNKVGCDTQFIIGLKPNFSLWSFASKRIFPSLLCLFISFFPITFDICLFFIRKSILLEIVSKV